MNLALFKNVMLVAAMVISCMAYEAKAAEEIKVGGQWLTRGDIIGDFLNVAFADKLWNETVPDDSDKTGLGRATNWAIASRMSEGGKKSQPWLAQYLNRPDGLPRHNVINKWDGEITIGVGWPLYRKDLTSLEKKELLRDDNVRLTTKAAPLIEQQVKELIPVIEKQTGLKARFILHGDPREFTTNHARIRILVMDSWPTTGVPVANLNLIPPYDDERLLWTGIPFESSSQGLLKGPLDGYMLSEADNTPGLVICKITSDFPKKVIKALISECIVKAMGLPATSDLVQHSLIGPWTETYNPRKDANQSEQLATESKKFTASLTPYDQLMLGLLYCPAIKAGMDKFQIQRILMSNDKCISQYLNPSDGE